MSTIITPGSFVRKPFYVEAIQVNASNMAAVAHWCDGKVVGSDTAKHAYVKVNVVRAQTERLSRAYANDWVVRTPAGYKVYRDKAFGEWFDESKADKFASIRELVHEAMATQHEATKSGRAVDSIPHGEAIARKIHELF